MVSLLLDGRAWDWLPTWRPKHMPDQSGKVAIVTGPTLDGMGYEQALALAHKGARVILAGRNRSKGEAALHALLKEVPDAKAEFMELDLASLASVKAFADAFIARNLPLHILLNNASVMFVPFGLTEDGFESHFGINHLGHYLLTRLLTPVLESSAPARVVTVSSIAAYFPDVLAFLSKYLPASWLPEGVSEKVDFSEPYGEPHYNSVVAYGRSKLASLLFSRALDRRLHPKRIYSNAAHPGALASNLLKYMRHGVEKRCGKACGGAFAFLAGSLLLKPRQGAVTPLFLATAAEVEEKDIHGRFYRPQAIPWPLPPSATEEMEERVWEVSEELVAKYL